MALPAHISSAPSTPGQPRQPVYALVGNPNCGKSTLFNALTGLKQKVGNYPGVTVEKKIGTAYSQHGHPITIIDLPGAYSLAARSPDEAVTRDVLLGRRTDTPQPDRILCIVDATNLERNLYLVHQILDLGRPVILVVNMMDLAARSGLTIRIARLEKELGIPVIACEAVNGTGLIELRLAMSRSDLPLSRHAWDVPAAIAPAVAELQASLAANDGKRPLIARAEALLLLTDQDSVRVAGSTPLGTRTAETLTHWEKRWEGEGTDWAGTLVTSRYEAIGRLAAEVVQSSGNTGPTVSDKIDAVVTHPVWGWLVLGVGDDAALPEHLHFCAGADDVDWRSHRAARGLGEGASCRQATCAISSPTARSPAWAASSRSCPRSSSSFSSSGCLRAPVTWPAPRSSWIG